MFHSETKIMDEPHVRFIGGNKSDYPKKMSFSLQGTGMQK